MNHRPATKLAVIGGGAWGTALAIHFAKQDFAVKLWLREVELVERIRTRRDNPLYLPGIVIPEQVTATGELSEAVQEAELILLVAPAQFARQVYRNLAPHLQAASTVVVAAKGIEEGTLALPLEVAGEELGAERSLAVLSGPSFARELVAGKPTAVVVAAEREALAVEIQRTLSSPVLRLYSSADPIGVQVAGALKNVIAIAAGTAESLEMGPNTLAALITRGLAEISRLGSALGGQPATFRGLAGLGDLVLTCTGGPSRNRRVGLRLGGGERLEDILSSSRSVAEGVWTTRSARELALQKGIEMPIVEEIHRLLFDDGSAVEALTRLMNRPLRNEE